MEVQRFILVDKEARRKELQKAWREKNRVRLNAELREWKHQHKELVAARAKAYQQKHATHINEYNRKYRKRFDVSNLT